MGWTDEKIADLIRYWNEGMTTGEIGKKLGVSKNAVVGKAHRLGLPGRPSPIRRDVNTCSTTSEKSKQTAKTEGKVSTKAIKKTKTIGVSLNDLTHTSCRWPEGDPKEPGFHFCGKEALPDKPYCREHCKIAYSEE
ncbi:MAG: GcrA family cell cycle regulator [Alphaproteobacteria bacterium]|nr:GcrA family cell cycle regulator [Alphaproteobacteria bacterium]